MNSGQNRNITEYRTVSSAFIDSILYSAEQFGLDRQALISKLPIPKNALDSPTNRVSETSLHELLELVLNETEKEDIGLDIGAHSRPGTYNALGYAAMSCSSLWEAFQLIPRYESIVLELGKTRVEKHGDNLHLIWGTSEPNKVSRALADTILSSWLTLARWLSGKYLSPSITQLSYPEPENINRYAQFFNSKLAFSCPENAFIFTNTSALQATILHADLAMRDMMQQRAKVLKEQLASEQKTYFKVLAILERNLPLGCFSLSDIAKTLAFSERTLRRRLNNEGHNFQTLLNTARHRLALHYLLDPTLSILDIALLLGYQEHSSFSAAFKIWQGEAPQAYRRQFT